MQGEERIAHETAAGLLDRAWSALTPETPAAARAAALRDCLDGLLPVWAGLRVNEVYWRAYSYDNRGDSAAFLAIAEAALADPACPADWRERRAGELGAAVGTKLFRDWNTLIAAIRLAAGQPAQARTILNGVFINLLLLRRGLNPRLAADKSDLEHTAYALKRALVALLESVHPSEELYGLLASLFRLLPQISDEDRIGSIRALSERFDEDRDDPADPWRTRANSLRKAIHQKPSEQNIRLVEDYLSEQADIAAGRKPGPCDQPEMVELARDLLAELKLFWSVVADRGQIEQAWAALLAGWPFLGEPAHAELAKHFASFSAAAADGDFLAANAQLTLLRRRLKKLCQDPGLPGPGERGAFRFALLNFEVAAEHLSFAYQGSLCNRHYARFSLAELRRAVELLCQVVRSVRASGGGDQQLGRTGMLLEQENQSGGRQIAVLRGIIKDILNQTKACTDALKRQTEAAILAMIREWQPELDDFQGDRHLIALYNAHFRSTSFLHLGEYAAFLAAALLPYGEARSRLEEAAAAGAADERLFWRFHGDPPAAIPGEGELRYLVGGKAASLLAMHAAGLPVPEGFCVATKAGRFVQPAVRRVLPAVAPPAEGGARPAGLAQPEPPEAGLDPAFWARVLAELSALEQATGLRFGDPERPLLVSVRSGAPVSMPGMMDTILNIGLSQAVLARQATDPAAVAFWYDCRFHLVWLYASSVHASIPMPRLATAIKAWYRHRAEIHRLDWTAAILDHALELYRSYTGEDFPEDPLVQLERAIVAVFRSWNSLRAHEYRAINHIPDHLGTGVVVQRMVFGNRDGRSASGVYFTRDPESGRADFGEMVVQGQGEEVVSGQNIPVDIQRMAALAPQAWRQLLKLGHALEARHHLPQDIEFTLESGRLWVLQSRTARLTTRARLNALLAMVDEGLIRPDDALDELNPEALEDLDSTTFAQRDIDQAELVGAVLAHGLGVFHGVARGFAAFSLEGIRRLRAVHPGCQCVLVKEDTKPEDIEAMYEAAACATRVGGPTSHAAINARVIGRPCVVNCTTLTIVKDSFDAIQEVRVGDRVIREGDPVSLDGNRALFIQGLLPVQAPEADPQSRQARERFLAWHRERELRRGGEE